MYSYSQECMHLTMSSHLMIQKTVLVFGGLEESRVYKKGEKYINGCCLPDEVDTLDARRIGDTDPINVVAIDFGTTCCTLAYSLDGDKEHEVRYLRLEGDNARIPTSVVIDDKGKVFAFGRDAQRRYLKLTEAQKQTHHFFHQIKMNLQHDKEVNWTYEIVAMNGKYFFLLEVIAVILRHLKEKFLTIEIRGGIRGQLEMENFKWVLTVPAMWKARGKQLMREAAYKAGIGSKDGIITSLTLVKKNESMLLSSAPSKLSSTSANPKLLSLALEPEAAAIYCLGQVKRTKAKIRDPQCYVVLDIGGGTVDITAHKINSDDSIDVILPPMGNDWGGVRVNQLFKEFLAELVDDPHFHEYLGDDEKAPKHRAHLQEIIDQTFEIQKQMFGSEDETKDLMILVNLPFSFMRVYEDSLEDRIESLNDPRVTLSDSDLCIHYSKLEEIIQPVYTNIIAEIERCFRTLPKGTVVDMVFLVGGFGACKLTHRLLEPEIKRIFFSSPQLQIYRPDFHKLAVVNGAVESVLNKAVVRARVVDASYGAICSRSFDPAIHDPKQKFYNDDRQEKCNNLFTPFALRGDVVEAGRVLVQSFYPIKHNQHSMNFELYSSQSRNIMYARDPKNKPIDDVNCIGQLTVDMPVKEGDKNREVKLAFDFTHSEIQVEAYDIASGNRVSTVLDFLTDDYCKNTKQGSDIF